MSNVSVSRDAPFAHLWPWPGNIFLFLLAVWFMYMGYIASLADVKTAFYGLGGVTVLLLLLGLRTIGRRPVARRNREPARVIEENLEEVRDRRDLDDYDMRETDAVIDSPAAIPMNSRMRERERERERAEVDMRRGDDVRVGSSTVAVAADEGTLEETVRNLTSMLMRERAERGAALAKIETDVRGAVDEIRREINDLRNAAASQGEGGAAIDGLDGFLKKEEFNRAVNQRLIPTIEDRIGSKIADAVRPEALRAALGKAAQTLEDGARTDVDKLRNELGSARELAEKAIRMAAEKALGEGGEALAKTLDELRVTVSEDRHRVDAVEKQISALGSAGAHSAGLPALAEDELNGLKERMNKVAQRTRKAEEKAETIDELRRTVDDMTKHISRMGEHYQELANKVEGAGAAPAASPSGTADVSELRDALSVIIAQNREIREQQDKLSGRISGGD